MKKIEVELTENEVIELKQLLTDLKARNTGSRASSNRRDEILIEALEKIVKQ